MKTSLAAFLLTALLLAPRASAEPAPTVQSFQMRAAYKDKANSAGACKLGEARSLTGHEPTAPGRFPVFLYLTGTTMNYQGPEAKALTQAMAERGFVAASVEYDNAAYAYCAGMESKARCVFGKAESESALSKLCARPNADCDLGVVVAGFSQGANLGALSKNFEPRVRGAYLMGHGHRAANAMDSTPCMKASATALGPDEIRSVNGEHDGLFGSSRERVRKQLALVLGIACNDATDCIKPSGAGWYIVKDSEPRDGSADHCYFLDAADGFCAKFKGLDPAWLTGSGPWAMPSNLDWLAGRITR